MRAVKQKTQYIDPETYTAMMEGRDETEFNYFKKDVFSLGLCFLEAMLLENFSRLGSPQNINKLNEKLAQVSRTYGRPFDTIVEKMLCVESRKRPNFKEVKDLATKLGFFDIENEICFHKNIPTGLSNLGIFAESNLITIPEGMKESSEVYPRNPQSSRNTPKNRLWGNEVDSINDREELASEVNFYQNIPQETSLLYENDPTAERRSKPNSREKERKNQIFLFQPAIHISMGMSFEELKLHAKRFENLKFQERRDHMKIFWNELAVGGEAKIFCCEIGIRTCLVVKIFYEIKNVMLLDVLSKMNVVNSIKTDKILKVEEFYLEPTDDRHSTLYMVFKRKKWDLSRALERLNFSSLEKLKIARQITDALACLVFNDGSRFAHGDLKPANILLDTKNNVFLIDFSVSQLFHEGEKMQESIGFSRRYAAPEQIIDKSIDPKTDIWSLGILFIELFFGTDYTKEVSEELKKAKYKEPLKIDPRAYREYPWKTAIAVLIESMLKEEPSQRIDLLHIIAGIDTAINAIEKPLNGRLNAHDNDLIIIGKRHSSRSTSQDNRKSPTKSRLTLKKFNSEHTKRFDQKRTMSQVTLPTTSRFNKL